jgi:hypothetical protein
MSRHSPIDFVAGDDWEIQATLLDEDGTPYDLSGASGAPNIMWCLNEQCGNQVISSDKVQISIIDALNGKCSVLIPSSVSVGVTGGFYTDALRLVMAGETGTLLMGMVNVICDPWTVSAVGTTAHRTIRTVYGRRVGA